MLLFFIEALYEPPASARAQFESLNEMNNGNEDKSKDDPVANVANRNNVSSIGGRALDDVPLVKFIDGSHYPIDPITLAPMDTTVTSSLTISNEDKLEDATADVDHDDFIYNIRLSWRNI